MTILQGTMQDGTVLPVQVDSQGRLVAEGLQGAPGPEGPAGAKGDKGDKGDPGTDASLPGGAGDGDYLSWNNGSAVWVTPATGGGLNQPPAAVPGGSLVIDDYTFSTAGQLIEFKANSDTDWADSYAAIGGTIVQARWKGDVGHDSPHGTDIRETVYVSGPDNTSKEYQWGVVDKLPDPLTPTTATTVALAQWYLSNVWVIEGINSPCVVYGITTATSAEVSVNSGPWAPLPASPDVSSIRVFPGDTLQIRHMTPNISEAVSTTAAEIGDMLGTATPAVLETVNMSSGVAEPEILAPAGGSTGLYLQPQFLSSAYAGIGSAGPHASSSWQVATDAGFANVVSETVNDTTSKTSWQPSALTGLTTYYVRVRYSDGTFVSPWSPGVSFTTGDYLPPLVNGTVAKTSSTTTWTVPAKVYRIAVKLEGHNSNDGRNVRPSYGATYEWELNVIPGEKFRLQSGWIFGPDTGGANFTQSSLWICVGNAGAGSTTWADNGYESRGGDGGIDSGGQGQSRGHNGYSATGGYGGTQSAGGSGGQSCHNSGWCSSTCVADSGKCSNHYGPGNGGALGGGGGGGDSVNSRQMSGSGGSGWFGGQGGWITHGEMNKCCCGGGGGSSHCKVPAERDPKVLIATGGSSTGGGITIRY